jgi:hypothetical protein
MRPVIRLSQAWLDRLGWLLAEAASFIELDLASAEPAGAGDTCPRCPRHHTDYESSVFDPDPATVTAEHEKGRTYVRCICGATYWFAAVDVLSAPTEDARVRAASATLTLKTGALHIEGQAAKIAEPLPPGTFVGMPPIRYAPGWYRRNPRLFFGSDPDNALGPIYYRRLRTSLPPEG